MVNCPGNKQLILTAKLQVFVPMAVRNTWVCQNLIKEQAYRQLINHVFTPSTLCLFPAEIQYINHTYRHGESFLFILTTK
jgi:hypothetical protein